MAKDFPIIYLDSNATSFVKHTNTFRVPNFNYNIRSNTDIDLDNLYNDINQKLETTFNLPKDFTTIFTLGATDSLNIAGNDIFQYYSHIEEPCFLFEETIHNSLYSQILRFQEKKNIRKYEIQYDLDGFFKSKKPKLLNIFFNPASSFIQLKSVKDNIDDLLYIVKHKSNIGHINNVILDFSQYIDWDKNLNWIQELIDYLSFSEYNLYICFGFHKKLAMQPGAGILLHWSNIYNKNRSKKLINRYHFGGTGSEDILFYEDSFFPAGTFDITHYLHFDKLLSSGPILYKLLLDNYHINLFGCTTDFLKEEIDNFIYEIMVDHSIVPHHISEIDPSPYIYSSEQGPDYIFNIVDDFVKQTHKAKLVARTGKFCSKYWFDTLTIPEEKLGYLRLS